MTNDFNKILKNLSVDGVQIDKFDHQVATDEQAEIMTVEEEAITDSTSPKSTAKKRGRKKQVSTPSASGRRFRGRDYTSTRIRKDLMALLRLLFPEMTSVELMEHLIVQYLAEHEKLLKKKMSIAKY